MKSFNVLLVEDSPADVLLARETFVEGKLKGKLHSVSSVPEALEYLHFPSLDSKNDRPDLILLDLNLPGASGYKLLKKIKTDPRLKSLPVVVLTASHNEEDIQKCYKLGANSMVSKPIDLYDFMRLLQTLEEYWLEVASLPNLPIKRKENEGTAKKTKKGGTNGTRTQHH